MLPFFSYKNFKNYMFLLLLLFFLLIPFAQSMFFLDGHPVTELTVVNDYWTWRNFATFSNTQTRSKVAGMPEFKRYSLHSGYLQTEPTKNLTDFDDQESASAVSTYRNIEVLPPIGKIDTHTSCSCSSGFSPNQPMRWRRPLPMALTYAFSPENMIRNLTLTNIKSAFQRAFSHWSAVAPVSFVETENYNFADIKIGFYSGVHGGEVDPPFDGPLGQLGHATMPEGGMLHLDADETWAVDFEEEESEIAIDLESVATHEIGHIMGLEHSPSEEAIMFPGLPIRTKKVDITIDDVLQIEALYGLSHVYYSRPNPNSSNLIMEVRRLGWKNMILGMMIPIIYLGLL